MLSHLSPIDGRYHEQTKELRFYFSELALIRYRLTIEIEYFIALSHEDGIKELPRFSDKVKQGLRNWYKNFSVAEAERVKQLETATNHDVKAVEYFLKEKIAPTPLQPYAEFFHFALTSEDINNLAYSLMWQDAIQRVYLPSLTQVYQELKRFSLEHKAQPLLALTHGQSATPTTMGKEFAVFASRLKRQLDQLKSHRLLGKLNGATGTWGAHAIAYPEVDWPAFSRRFITALGLEPNLLTTQIEPHDSLAESYHILSRLNTILLDFSRDVWLYISRGVFSQTKKSDAVGSSTMPHKINPIQFENAEGNLGIANAYLSHLAQKLPTSRLQRDLSDSTVLRNQGVPLAHSLLACKNILKGLACLTVNKQRLENELAEHWEVLAEAIQIILRKCGHSQPYEKLKELTRGEKMTKEIIQKFTKELDIPADEKSKLVALTPETYTGLADKLPLNLV